MAMHTSVKKLGKGVVDRMLDQPVFFHPFKPEEKAMALVGDGGVLKIAPGEPSIHMSLLGGRCESRRCHV